MAEKMRFPPATPEEEEALDQKLKNLGLGTIKQEPAPARVVAEHDEEETHEPE